MTSKLLALLLLVLSPLLVTSTCPSNCAPNGDCVEGECACSSGFAGADCSFPFEICTDQELFCFDGAKCAESSKGYYQCDCSTAFDGSPFSIEQCENPQAVVCASDDQESLDVSEYSFCTNGGDCVDFIRKGEKHAGCNCRADFEGRHCQYAKGRAPPEEIKLAEEYPGEKRGDAGGVAVLFISVVVIGVASFAGFLVYKNVMTSKNGDHARAHATLSDLNVETLTDAELSISEEDSPVVGGSQGHMA
jgi:hypothetical protein